jgi:hypothetical protein
MEDEKMNIKMFILWGYGGWSYPGSEEINTQELNRVMKYLERTLQKYSRTDRIHVILSDSVQARRIQDIVKDHPSIIIDIPVLKEEAKTYHEKVHAFIDEIYYSNIEPDPPSILIVVVEHDAEHHQTRKSIYNQIMTLYGSDISNWYISDQPLPESEFIIPGTRRGGTRKKKNKNKNKKKTAKHK